MPRILETRVRYIATFTPQAWVNDYAIDVDPEGPTEWDCTEEIENMHEEPRNELLRTGHDIDDWLKGDPKAPEWIFHWQGPFEIHVREEWISE